MALPINISELVNGHIVEGERIEFKRGWNPEEIIHTICAFANDLHNWGGGYVIVGIEENQGAPVLPPIGVDKHDLDRIQGEIVNLAYQISPNYFPIVQPYWLMDNHILVIWCPAGDNRPYTAPSTLGGKSQRWHYIRVGSKSIVAKEDNLRRLQELTARIPFDDRINGIAKLHDLDLGLIQAFLQEVKSELYEESLKLSFEELCRQMLIAKGPNEAFRPTNVGILFFSQKPEKYLDRAWIEIVIHNDEFGESFEEIYFKGPIHHQLRAALAYLKNNIIQERVIKTTEKAESERFYNYPYQAIEEILANAVYHKSYEMSKPIEVQVYQDKITILNFPGPIFPVDAQILEQNKRLIARDYRNRRIGDFLKELHLTEGRGTGFPRIYRALENNKSPQPVFEPDPQGSYFLATIFKKKEPSNQVSNQVSNQANLDIGTSPLIRAITSLLSEKYQQQELTPVQKEKAQQYIEKINNVSITILQLLAKEGPKKKKEIFDYIKLSNQTKNTNQYLVPLISLNLIQPLIQTRPNSPLQKYIITYLGTHILKVIDESTITEE